MNYFLDSIDGIVKVLMNANFLHKCNFYHIMIKKSNNKNNWEELIWEDCGKFFEQ